MRVKLINRTAFASTLRNDLNEKLNELSDKTDIPKSKLFDQAVTLLLNKYNEKIMK